MKSPIRSRGLFGRKYLDLQERARLPGRRPGDRELPPESLYDAFKVIRFGGIITFFGLHFGGKSKVRVDMNDLVFRKVSLIPTFGFDRAADMLRGIVEGTLPVIKAVMLPHG